MRAPTLCAIFLTAATVLSAQGTNVPASGITIFEDINYGGRSVNITRDIASLASRGIEDRVSSFRIARGESWEVCNGRDFADDCQVFTGDQPDLRDTRWNDKISSLRPVRAGFFGGGRRPAETVPGATGSPLELFAGTNFSGQRVALIEETPDLRRRDFNDRAMSLRVPRGQSWDVCVGIDFDECKVVDGDVPDLNAIGLGRVISSAMPHFTRGGGRGNQQRGSYLVLYPNTNFRGRSVEVDTAEPALNFFRDLVGSVEVFGGRWELCDASRFRGNCVVIRESVRDLRTLGLTDAVLSIRPR